MTFDEINAIVQKVRYLDWNCIVESKLGGDMFLVWDWVGVCAVTGRKTLFRSRKWRLSRHMTESEIVQTAFAAVLAATEHEVREAFHYEDARPFHPHIDVRALMAASEHVAIREEQVR